MGGMPRTIPGPRTAKTPRPIRGPGSLGRFVGGLTLGFTVGSTLVACTAPVDDDTALGDAPTWHQDVAPILAARCGACHDEENVGPFSLLAYDDARVLADLIGNTLARGRMPPFGVQPEDVRDDLHYLQVDFMPDAEVDLVRAWAFAEAPLGDADTAAALPPRLDRTLTDANDQLVPEAAVDASAERETWACVIQDPELTERRYLRAAQVAADDLTVLHHVGIFLVPPEEAAAVRARVDASGTFPCFGAQGFESWRPIQLWMPDSLPMRFPDGHALAIEPGSLFVQQVHAHGWIEGGTDRSGLDLLWSETDPGAHGELRRFGNATAPPVLQADPDDEGEPTFLVPTNPASHHEVMRSVMAEGDGPYTVFAVSGRMNYAGRSLAVSIEHQDGSKTDLLRISEWDLDWQRLYHLDAEAMPLPTLAPGDTVVIDCGYWNLPEYGSDLGRILDDLQMDDPVPMALGPGILDEQCSAILGLAEAAR